MGRVQGKRFFFDGDDKSGYTATVGSDAAALLMPDSVGWRGVLLNWGWNNPTGIFLTPVYWRQDCLNRAVRDFEAMIDDNGDPKIGGRTGDGEPRWYGEARFIGGSLLDGSGTWARLGRNIVTLPPGNRKLVPHIADARWHPAIAELQICVRAATFDINELLRSARAGEEPRQEQFIAETLFASLIAEARHNGRAIVDISETSRVSTLLLSRKERAERLLFHLSEAAYHAHEMHLDGTHLGIIPARVARWLQQARATGAVELAA